MKPKADEKFWGRGCCSLRCWYWVNASATTRLRREGIASPGERAIDRRLHQRAPTRILFQFASAKSWAGAFAGLTNSPAERFFSTPSLLLVFVSRADTLLFFEESLQLLFVLRVGRLLNPGIGKSWKLSHTLERGIIDSVVLIFFSCFLRDCWGVLYREWYNR